MKRFQKISSLLLILLIVASYSQVHAQKGHGLRNADPEELAQKQTDQMKEQIELGDDEWASVQDINLKYTRQAQEAFKETGRDREAMHAKMKEINKARNGELKEILSKEQFKVYREIQEANRQEMRKRNPGGPGGPGGPEGEGEKNQRN